MESDEEGAFNKPQSVGDDDGSSLTGRNESDELHWQRDLDEARHVEARLPVSGEDGNGLIVKEASEDAGMGGGLVQSDVPEKDQISGEVVELREVVTVEEDEASGAVENQEVKVADFSDSSEEATETSDVAGGCVDNQTRDIEDLDDTEQNRETVIGDRVENDKVAAVGDGNAFSGESSVSEHVGSVDKVAEEKDLDEAVVEVPQIAEEEVSLDGTATRDEIGSAVSVDVGCMVSEEKNLDAAVGEVLHVAVEEVYIGETVLQRDREGTEFGVESTEDDAMVKADDTTIDTVAAGLDNVFNMEVEANETEIMDGDSGKLDQTKQADDTSIEMEKGESEMMGDAIQVKEEVNRMISEDAPMESEGREGDRAVAKNNNMDTMEEIKSVNDEFDGDDMLEKTAEAEDRGAEIEVAEQENVVRMEIAEAREDADGSCMVEETMKGEDAGVTYEADYMDNDADVMEEAVDAEEAEPTGESEEQSRSSAGGKRKRGKSSKGSGRAPLKKKIEEDVCFICFEGGELVLCDRRFTIHWTIFFFWILHTQYLKPSLCDFCSEELI